MDVPGAMKPTHKTVKAYYESPGGLCQPRGDARGSHGDRLSAIARRRRPLEDFREKQHFLNTVYERFFQGYSVKTADTHGIVYTPQEISSISCAPAWKKSCKRNAAKVCGTKRSNPRPLHRHRQLHCQLDQPPAVVLSLSEQTSTNSPVSSQFSSASRPRIRYGSTRRLP